MRLKGALRPRPARTRRGLLAGGLLAVLVIAVAVLPAGRELAAALRRQLLDLGALARPRPAGSGHPHAAVPYPGGVAAAAAAGYVYGFGFAAPVLLASGVASALLAYWLARTAGRPVARRVLGSHRLAGAERLVERGGTPTLIAVRLVPLIPFNAVCDAAGLGPRPATRGPPWWPSCPSPSPLPTWAAACRTHSPPTGGCGLPAESDSLLLAVRAGAHLHHRRPARARRPARSPAGRAPHRARYAADSLSDGVDPRPAVSRVRARPLGRAHLRAAVRPRRRGGHVAHRSSSACRLAASGLGMLALRPSTRMGFQLGQGQAGPTVAGSIPPSKSVS